MKKLALIGLVGTAVALSACASKTGDANYGYESAAPYSDSRTVGTEGAVETSKGDTMFRSGQMKK